MTAWVLFAHGRSDACRQIHIALQTLRGISARRGWFTWKATFQSWQKFKFLCARMCRQHEARALRTWIATQRARAHTRSVVRWVTGAFTNRRLRMAFSAWKMPEADEVKMYLRSIMHRAALAMHRRTVYAALITWLDFWRSRREACRRLRGAVREMRGLGCRRAWFTWLELVQTNLKVKTCLAAMCMRCERAAWRTWVACHDQQDYLRHILRSMRPVGQELRRALNTWCYVRRGDLAFKRAISSLTLQAERRVFNTWLAHASRQAIDAAKCGLRLSVSHLMNRHLSRAFNHWLAFFEWPAAAHRLCLMFDCGKMREAFLTWRLECRRGRSEHLTRKLEEQANTARIERGVAFAEQSVLKAELVNLEHVNSSAAAATESLYQELERRQREAGEELLKLQLAASQAQERASLALEQEQQRTAEEKQRVAAERERAATEREQAANERQKANQEQQRASDEYVRMLTEEQERGAEQHARLSEASRALKSEKEEMRQQLEELRVSTASELARVGREAALTAGLREEIAGLRDELLQADASGNDSTSKLAAAERELALLRKQLLAAAAAPPAPEMRTASTSPLHLSPPPTPAPTPPPPPPKIPKSPTPTASPRLPAPAPRPPMRTTATSPPPIRLPAPPEVKPPSTVASPPVLMPRTPIPLPEDEARAVSSAERPLSESLLRHTVASKQWDNHRRRATEAWRMSKVVAWKPSPASAVADLQTFGEQRFLQDIDKDADKFPFGARARFSRSAAAEAWRPSTS